MTRYRHSTAGSRPLPAMARERAHDYEVLGDTDTRPAPGELTFTVRQVADDLRHADPSDLDVSTARHRLRALATLEGAVAAATARTLKQFARDGGVNDDGATSPTAWLRANGNRTQGEAARLGRLANLDDDLPATLDALAAGDVSATAADTIARTVPQDRLGSAADVEELLLPAARAMTAESFRGQVHEQTQRRDGDAMRKDEARQHRARRMSITEQPDGLHRIEGLLPHETALKARTLFDALMTHDPEDTPEPQRRSHVQRTCDAFADLVDLGLDHGDLPASGGQSRPHLVVVTDVTTVDTDVTDDGAPATDDPLWADMPGGLSDFSDTPLSPQAVRRIACDASITRVTMDGAQVLNVGRATPSWSGPQRTAIRVRDGHCRGSVDIARRADHRHPTSSTPRTTTTNRLIRDPTVRGGASGVRLATWGTGPTTAPHAQHRVAAP